MSRGLYLIFPDSRPPVHFDQTNGLPQNWIRFLYEDHEANIWAGIGSAGLVAIHRSAFATVSSPDQWQGRTVSAVAAGHDGGIWVGTEGSGLYHHVADRWEHFGEAEGLANPFIWSVHEASANAVWVGCWTGGPYHLAGGRFVQPEDGKSVSVPVLALLSDPLTGEVLVGNRDGLLALQGNKSTWLYRTPEGAPVYVSSIVRDRNGIVWFGRGIGGLGRIAHGVVSVFGHQDGLVADSVQCLFADEDDTLWIGTTAGLSRYRQGRFSMIGPSQGLASNVVFHIEDDGLGNLWLSSRRGLQRIAKDELKRCADGAIPALSSRIFDRNDGLPTVDFRDGIQGAGAKTADGRLWFTSSKGLVAVSPSRIEHNTIPPPVVIESMLVDGQPVPLETNGANLRLSPSHQRLEFRFAGLSFVAPGNVRFKYRLDGIDADWVDAGPKRAAFYSRLPAGAYRFRAIACNNDGVWNTTGAAVSFVVAPFVWQTWWFLGSSTLLALSVVALFARHITHRRMQRRLEQLEREHAVERERARIAQDIHDDIGTTLTRIAMFSQPEGNELEEPRQTAAALARIYSTTRDAIRALDEIVWAIDPRQDTLDELVGYMGRFAQEMLDAANIRCRLRIPVDLPAWAVTAEVRHNLFLAFKEVLNNVAKHAGASEVRISLELRTGAFVVAVQDDGRGFNRAELKASTPGRIKSGRGLNNLERRLARIGGRCEIVSAPGQGTTVSLIVAITGGSSESGARLTPPA